MPTQFHPSLGQLLPLDRIPNEGESLRDVLATLLDSVFVKNLICSQKPDGSSGFYSMTIVSYNGLGINIPIAQDLRLVLNPTASGASELPVRLEYSWPIVKYISDFRIDTFDNSIRSLYDIVIALSGWNHKRFLREVIHAFFPGIDGIQQFRTQFNQAHDNALGQLNNPDATVDDHIDYFSRQISSADISLAEFVYQSLISIPDEGPDRLKKLFSRYIDNIEDTVKEAITLDFKAAIDDLSVGLQFPRKWLKPVDENGTPLPETEFSILSWEVGSLAYSAKYGFSFYKEDVFNLTRSEIGNTGLIAEFSGLKVDLQKNRNIPEADADGRSNDFRGFYARQASITLPKKWFKQDDGQTLSIVGRDLLVGTGGVTGTLALETTGGDDTLWFKMGGVDGFSVGFKKFDLQLKQDSVVHSSIEGVLKLKKLKNDDGTDFEIKITGDLKQDGDFALTALSETGLVAKFKDYVNFRFTSLELGEEDGVFFIGASVDLEFPQGIIHTITHGKKISIPRIRFYADGTFEIVGGNAFLPINLSLPLGPVDMSVTGLHFGRLQRKDNDQERTYNYIGFDGGISVEPFGIDVRGEGVKYYYPAHDDGGSGFLHIETIKIDIVVPNDSPAVIINGMLTIPEPGVSQEYAGTVGFKSTKTELAGNAEMRLIPKYPAFVIDASVNLPKPIPLGSVSIYGFRGLIGHRYIVEKKAAGLPETASWYDYYKAPPFGISVRKMSSPEQTSGYSSQFTFGAGIVLGSSFDNGFLFSVRAMLFLQLPDLFAIEGRATILETKPGLTDTSEPPFYAFMFWSSTSIEIGAGANYKLPRSSGKIIEVHAEMRAAFYKHNPSDWFVNIGTKEKPNSSVLFKDLIKLRTLSYVMFSARGIELGARTDYKIKKKFGITVRIEAYAEVGAFISFERPQLGGYIKFGGMIYFKFIVKFKFTINAMLSAEVMKPAKIAAEVRFRVHVSIGFGSISATVKVKIKWELNKQVDRTPIPAIPLQPALIKDFVKGTHMLTNESFALDFIGAALDTAVPDPTDAAITKVLPLDTYIDVKAIKGLVPTAVSKIGGYTTGAELFTDLIPPKKTVKGGHTLRQVKHKYSIVSIGLKIKKANGWVDYHPYKALVDPDEYDDVSNFKIGYWQRSGNQYNAIRILANNPLSYLDSGTPGSVIPEQYGMTAATMFCHSESVEELICNFLNKPLGWQSEEVIIGDNNEQGGAFVNGVYFGLGRWFDESPISIEGIPVTSFQVTETPNSWNLNRSLSFNSVNTLVATFPEDVHKTYLKLTTLVASVRVRYLRYATVGYEDGPSIGLFQEIYNQVYTAEELGSGVEFVSDDVPFTRIIIEPILPQSDAIDALLAQMDSLRSEDGTLTDLLLYSYLGQQLSDLLVVAVTESLQGTCGIGDSFYCNAYQQLMAIYPFGDGYVSAPNFAENAIATFTDLLKNLMGGDPYILPLIREFEKWWYQLQASISNNDPYEIQTYNHNLVKDFADFILEQLLLLGNCECNVLNYTSLHEIVWETFSHYEFAQTIPSADAVQEEVVLMQQAISRNPQPIWRPYSAYCLELKLSDTVDDTDPRIFTYKFAFRTGGPVGHFHSYPGANYGGTFPDKFPLTNLKSYIDFKRSYPDMQGNIIMSKPVFTGAEKFMMQVVFLRPFVYNLFKSWNSYNGNLQAIFGDLDILIVDPVNEAEMPYPLPVNIENTPVPDSFDWVNDGMPHTPLAFSYMQNAMNSMPGSDIQCVLGDYGLIRPNSPIITTHFKDLKPQKLYTAIIRNAVSPNNVQSESTVKEVHRFVFQTSRYAHFGKQIASFTSEEAGEARFEVVTNANSDSLVKATSVIGGDFDDNLSKIFQHPFDCVYEGLLKLPVLDPASRTEINVVRTADNSVFALLVRSPEPFNEPRIPANLAKLSMFLTTTSDQVVPSNVLLSKDGSQAFVTCNVSWPENFKLKFRYYEWDANLFGGTYKDHYLANNNYPFITLNV